MKKVISLLFLSNILLMASDIDVNDVNINKQKDKILKKQLKKAMDDEKKYAKEQMFYNQYSYDFKGSEVNQDSLKHIEDLEMDELDMDSVYD